MILATGWLAHCCLGAFLSSALSALGCGWMLKVRGQQQWVQSIRSEGPQQHGLKQGTPTLGGVVVLVAVCLAMAVVCDWQTPVPWWMLCMALGSGSVGLWDDALKIRHRSSEGLAGRYKLLCLGGVAVGVLCHVAWMGHPGVSVLRIGPHWQWALPAWGGLLLAWWMVLSGSNAVNLTDGVDGLVVQVSTWVWLGLLGLAWLQVQAGQTIGPASWVMQCGVVSACFLGACLGFGVWNAHPAALFMGDVGALGLGASMALLAWLMQVSVVWALMACVFVGETLSVMIQVGSFRWRGRRVFRMAPIHHHFELMGWKEPQVVARFAWLGFMACISGLGCWSWLS